MHFFFNRDNRLDTLDACAALLHGVTSHLSFQHVCLCQQVEPFILDACDAHVKCRGCVSWSRDSLSHLCQPEKSYKRYKLYNNIPVLSTILGTMQTVTHCPPIIVRTVNKALSGLIERSLYLNTVKSQHLLSQAWLELVLFTLLINTHPCYSPSRVPIPVFINCTAMLIF